MSWVLIADRSHHGPRFLERFETREEAEAGRARLIVDEPALKDVLFIVRAEPGASRDSKLSSSSTIGTA